jgi:hypothetical protein
MVTSSGNWLAGKRLFLKHGFEVVDKAPPTFDLLVKRFDDAPYPAFPKDWEARAARYPSGLTLFRSDQCPYIEDGAQAALEVAEELGIPAQVIQLETAQQVRNLSPSPYGVFNIVYCGRLLSYTYLGKKGRARLREWHQARSG